MTEYWSPTGSGRLRERSLKTETSRRAVALDPEAARSPTTDMIPGCGHDPENFCPL
jgi:hypothetical protein